MAPRYRAGNSSADAEDSFELLEQSRNAQTLRRDSDNDDRRTSPESRPPTYCAASSGADLQDSDQLLEQTKVSQQSAGDPGDDGWHSPTSRLPAKTLPLKSTTQSVRYFFWTGCIAITVIVGLSVLASKIKYLEPNTSLFQLNNPVSCDLMTQAYNGTSSLETAFSINLRGGTHLTFFQAKSM